MPTQGTTQFKKTTTVHVPYATDRFFLKTTDVETGDFVVADDTLAGYLIKDTANLANSNGYLELGTGGATLSSGVGYNESANASGNTTITVDASTAVFSEITTVSGSGSTTRIFVLATTNASEGTVLKHRVEIPDTDAITLEWRNATSGGTLLTNYVTDLSGNDAYAEFVYSGTAWKFLNIIVPSNA